MIQNLPQLQFFSTTLLIYELGGIRHCHDDYGWGHGIKLQDCCLGSQKVDYVLQKVPQLYIDPADPQ